jgi:hypothetical protein
MRIPSVLLAAATTVVLAGSLAACSGASGGTAGSDPAAPSASTSASAASSPAASGAATDLVGTSWHVEGKDGTTVRFDGLAVTVEEGGASSSFAWSAQGDQVLVGGHSSSLNGPVAAPWLTATTTVRRTAAGWTLLDASGATTARLTAGGTSESTTATTLLDAARPGAGVVDRPASALEGRWTIGGDARSAITFAHGGWRATSSCTTGAVGGQCVYRVLPGGRLLVTRTATPIRGCPIVDGPVRLQPSAITAIARSASFRIRGGTLTLFDRSGTPLGSLTRG